MVKRRSHVGGHLAGDTGLLAAALVGYEQQRSELVERIGQIRRQLGGRVTAATLNDTVPGRKRTMSAAARKRIAEAQRKRWVAYRKGQEPTSEKKTLPAKNAAVRPARKMSAAARKRIADAQRKRWAAVRAKKAAA